MLKLSLIIELRSIPCYGFAIHMYLLIYNKLIVYNYVSIRLCQVYVYVYISLNIYECFFVKYLDNNKYKIIK
jgi:hypothetical protein